MAKMAEPLSLSEIVVSKERKFSGEDWLYTKLVSDQHLKSFEKELPSLFGYLKRGDKKEGVTKYKKEIRDKRSRAAEKERFFLDFEQTCLRLLETEDEAVVAGLLKNLKKSFEKPPFNNPEFLNDVEGLILETAQSGQTKKTDYVAVETDNYMDILLCGTEVMGSCQRVNGNPRLNKCLLGYLLDSKNHILAIKMQAGDRGRIEARSLLKLLWDGKQPVLLRERFYPDPVKSEYAAALDELAVRKAKELGIPLLSSDGGGDKYPETLYALGGPAPFEYSDGSRGVEADGEYSIDNAKFLI